MSAAAANRRQNESEFLHLILLKCRQFPRLICSFVFLLIHMPQMQSDSFILSVRHYRNLILCAIRVRTYVLLRILFRLMANWLGFIFPFYLRLNFSIFDGRHCIEGNIRLDVVEGAKRTTRKIKNIYTNMSKKIPKMKIIINQPRDKR